MTQIINITSEALQATIRRLLPSQQGFGEDLQASNVITPIIDLTPTAEGSSVPQYLQTAIGYDDATVFFAKNGTATPVNTAGFYRIIGVAFAENTTAASISAQLAINNGLGDKIIWALEVKDQGAAGITSVPFDLTVFLQSGHSLKVISTNNGTALRGSVRQVATVTGVLVNPTGFTPE